MNRDLDKMVTRLSLVSASCGTPLRYLVAMTAQSCHNIILTSRFLFTVTTMGLAVNKNRGEVIWVLRCSGYRGSSGGYVSQTPLRVDLLWAPVLPVEKRNDHRSLCINSSLHGCFVWKKKRKNNLRSKPMRDAFDRWDIDSKQD